MQLITERLFLIPLQPDGMRALLARTTDPELIQPYTDMLDLSLAHPEQWVWYTAWGLYQNDSGDWVGDLCFKGLPENGQHEIGYDIPPMTPFVGRDFNATRAGIHADGLLKDAEIYTIFDTEKLLNRPASVQVGKTSGLAGIAYWINQNYHLTGEKQIDKHDPLVLALKGWVDAEYEDGRQTVLSVKELKAKIAELAPGRFAQV